MVTEASHYNQSNEFMWGRKVRIDKRRISPVRESENYTDRYIDKYKQEHKHGRLAEFGIAPVC